MTNIVGKLAPFRTIDEDEIANVTAAVRVGPLSGFIAAKENGGWWVSKLEDRWRKKLGVKHAISFNSATSALLAAGAVIDIRGHEFLVSPLTMSATVAAPMFAGGIPRFVDIEPETFGINYIDVMAKRTSRTKAIFVTNLFGHTANIIDLRRICDNEGIYLVEDASQSPMAMENGIYAGTVGHIGVFSLNVHKAINAGEGGIAVTNDDSLAFKLKCVRNHGENLKNGILGLNLRMNEPTAAIACAQTDKLDAILNDRIALAESLTEQLPEFGPIRKPTVRKGCRHVYYCWPILINGPDPKTFLAKMNALGVPLSPYVRPLYHLDAFKASYQVCPMAEEIHKRLAIFEICTYSPTELQVHRIGAAFRSVLDEMTQSA